MPDGRQVVVEYKRLDMCTQNGKFCSGVDRKWKYLHTWKSGAACPHEAKKYDRMVHCKLVTLY
jgi:hypothetical protein